MSGTFRTRSRASWQQRRLQPLAGPAAPPTIAVNTLEGGVDGTTITTGNSGGASGDVFQSVQVGTDATNRFSAAHARGTLGVEFATGATATTPAVGWTTTVGTRTEIWYRLYLYLTANPTVQHRILHVHSGATQRCSLSVRVDGLLQMMDSAGSTVAGDRTTQTLALNAWNRIEFHAVLDATVGQYEVRLYKTDPDAAIASFDEQVSSAATKNLGGSGDTWRFGVTGTPVANVPAWWADDLALSVTGWIGPSAAPSGTDADAGAASVTVAAADASPAVAVDAGSGVVPLSTTDASVAVTVDAGAASVGFTAAAATVDTVADVIADAGPAAVTVIAADAQAAVEVDAGPATVPLSAADANIGTAVDAGSASVGVAAADATADTAGAAVTADAQPASITLAAADASAAVVVDAQAAAVINLIATEGVERIVEVEAGSASVSFVAADATVPVAGPDGAPDAILAASNLAGTVDELWDDPTSPDAGFLDAGDPAAATDLRVSFPTPSVAPGSGGPKTFQTYVRRTPGAGADPTVILDLWEAGSFVEQLASVTVTSIVGQLVTGTLDPADLADPSGAGVELRVRGVP